jgi:hypothetical protein
MGAGNAAGAPRRSSSTAHPAASLRASGNGPSTRSTSAESQYSLMSLILPFSIRCKPDGSWTVPNAGPRRAQQRPINKACHVYLWMFLQGFAGVKENLEPEQDARRAAAAMRTE